VSEEEKLLLQAIAAWLEKQKEKQKSNIGKGDYA